MTGLSWNQRQELREMLIEAFQYNPDGDAYDTGCEVADSWLPVYYHDIRREWELAGCPNPEDFPNEFAGDIHKLMNHALGQLAWDYVTSITNNLTHAEALEALNEEVTA